MDEETPLLRGYYSPQELRDNIHHQFCLLVGIPPSDLPKRALERLPSPGPNTLYGRAVRRRRAQNATYMFTATLSNTLLLTQVVLGAALTALGASASSHILITIFGALNTVIAGLVAYLKSRGQPMRARHFRDDLDRVVDEIENSETMWKGIRYGVHGYDEVAIDDSVSVRSEVARLTRLYDKAVRSNTMNDPDMYMNATGDGGSATLRARPGPHADLPAITEQPAASAPVAGPSGTGTVTPAPVAMQDPDVSPASAPPKPKEAPKEEPKEAPKDELKEEPREESKKETDEEVNEGDKTAGEKGKGKEKVTDEEDLLLDHGEDTPSAGGSAKSAGGGEGKGHGGVDGVEDKKEDDDVDEDKKPKGKSNGSGGGGGRRPAAGSGDADESPATRV
ncbi:hypothetical protein EJ06DRAFT_501046 [Trichodelitschia bisporula]|uniref:SMODS and SLOG-associating 2TM effector domain-containing protein n=1 Tax=Trichodelitschia bisporula TaxID=703511 RepID=A0A6G1HIS6_9PEZI|nr:hypothetical protein EJ06DRAFT_501046 [Trichodelitschia bisporula]